MKDSFFWRAAACMGLVMAAALVGSLWYAAAQLGPSGPGARARTWDAPRAGHEARPVGVIAVTAAEGDLHRLYLIDTERRVILVYGGAANALQFTLLAARYYDVDARATVEKEFPFNPRGYTILDMKRFAPAP